MSAVGPAGWLLIGAGAITSVLLNRALARAGAAARMPGAVVRANHNGNGDAFVFGKSIQSKDSRIDFKSP